MNESGHRYFIINKPFNMVSQFISPDNVRLLGDLDFDFPEGTHAIGRLDSHSEGLLILTTNKKVTNLLFKGEVPHKRTYLVMVKHVVSEESVQQLRTGISIIVKGGEGWTTTPCDVAIVNKPPDLFHRPQALREQLPHSWLEISLTEGKFHQVRKMVMAIGHRCQRLIRTSIEDLELGDLAPGAVREIEEQEFFRLLKIKTSENITV
jgi:23S rRNA pseudouridine2457 synthase